MAEITLEIGAAAYCSDGFPGELKCLVVDPGTRAVTHLVIEPKLAHGTAVGLGYTEAEFKDLDPAEETLAEFVPGYEVPVQLLPSGEGWRGAGGPVADGEAIPQIREMETIPLLPGAGGGDSEVEEGGADRVRATDGDVGQFRGLRVNPDDGAVTQVLVKRHSWGHKELAIPIGQVSGFEAGIQLTITRQQARDLTA